mmetsp:Transcript_37549/g.69214  ORF Transcript_37549/g.69214 Transcript_37549/m.69214 type:complete len:86 (+) Transcript_37549:836-1093(+)
MLVTLRWINPVNRTFSKLPPSPKRKSRELTVESPGDTYVYLGSQSLLKGVNVETNPAGAMLLNPTASLRVNGRSRRIFITKGGSP